MRRLLGFGSGYLAIILILFSFSAMAQPGTLDATFNPGTGANLEISCSAVQTDGKVIIGGNFTSYNGVSRNRIARINQDGSLDASFNPGSGANNLVYDIAIQADGKILLVGDFNSFNGSVMKGIARLNSDGTLDPSFNPGSGVGNTINSVLVQPSDGKIFICGYFTTYNGINIKRIARLNSDGSLDATFSPGSGATNTVRAMALQSDGKIIIGGDFTSFNGTTVNRIARLNANGSLDATFAMGTGIDNGVQALALQSDGKVLLGGDFSTYNGTAANRFVRLNTNGTYDASFSIGTGANNQVKSIVLQSDGKIILGGNFSSYNGTTRNSIARINSNGTLDVTLDPVSGTGAGISTTKVLSNGKVMIGGNFTTFNGTNINRIARLWGDYTIQTSVSNTTFCAGASVAVSYSANADANSGNTFTVQLSNSAGSFASPVVIGSLTTTALSGTINATIPAGTSPGTGYRIRVVSSSPSSIGSDNGANLTVNSIPAAPTASAQTFCSATNPTVAALTATGTAIQWYAASTGGSALASSTALANGTTYYASQTVSGCESITRAGAAVTINTNPGAPTASAQNLCSGSGASGGNLSATGSNIQWYALPTGGSPLANATALSNGTTYYASQTVLGCESTTRASSLISLSQSPTVNSIPASTVYCQNAAFGLLAPSVSPNGFAVTTQNWEMETGVGSGTYAVLNTGYAFTLADHGKLIRYRATNACGTSYSTTSTLTINPNLPVGVSIVSSDANNDVCNGDAVVFTATPTNGGGGPVYQWKLNGNNVGSNSNTYTTNTLANNDVVSVVLTSNATCPTGNPATSNSIATVVNTVAPTFAVSPGPTSCLDAPVTYTTQSGQTNYIWSVAGVSGLDYSVVSGGLGSADPTVTLQWLTAGIKTVTVNYTGAGGCSVATPATSVTNAAGCANTWTGATSTNWSTPTNWNLGWMPGQNTNVIIPPTANSPSISNAQTRSVRDIQINAGATLNMGSSATLNLWGGGNVVINGNLNMAGFSRLYFKSGTYSVGGAVGISFEGITIENAAVNFQTNFTINRSLILWQNGYLAPTSFSPTYGPNSTLTYTSGSFTVPRNRGKEWTSTSGPGYPAAVSLLAQAYLNLSSAAFPSTNLGAGSLSLSDMACLIADSSTTPFAHTLTVNGNVSLGQTSSAVPSKIRLSTQPSNLIVKGNLNVGAYGQLFTQNTQLIFSGLGNTTITSNGLGSSIQSISINSGGNVSLNSNLTLSGLLTFVSGNLDLNGNNLFLGSTGSLQNETVGSSIINTQPSLATGNGYVEFNGTLASTVISPANSGNLGISLTGSVNFGATSIRRFSEPVLGVGGQASVSRVYLVQSANAPTGAVGLSYLPSELNGNTETPGMFNLFYSLGPNFASGASYNDILPTSLNGSGNLAGLLPSSVTGTFALTVSTSAVNPISGSFTIGTGPFATLEEAINEVNVNGVGAGGLNLILPEGSTTTMANVSIDILNNPPTVNNPLVIGGTGALPLPIINAGQGGTLDRDAVIKLIGTDNVTFQNLVMVDPPLINDDNYERMEWGIALLKRDPGNGCINTLVRNCTIILQAADTASTGIYMGNHSTDPTVYYTVTQASGLHSNINIRGNNLRNLNRGIWVRGYDDPANILQEGPITIGDTVNTLFGNTISRLGGNATPAYGIRTFHANRLTIGNNTIQNQASGGVPAIGQLTGISVEGTMGTFYTLHRNNLQLLGAVMPNNLTGIYARVTGGASLRITNNDVQGLSMTQGSSGTATGILVEAAPNTLRVLNNRVRNVTNCTTSGGFRGIAITGGEWVQLIGDTIRNCTLNTLGSAYAIYNQTPADSIWALQNTIQDVVQNGMGDLFGYANEMVSNNLVVGSGNGGPQLMSVAAGGAEIISNNTVKNLTVFGPSNLVGIRSSGRPLVSKTANNNAIRYFSAGTGTMEGLGVINGTTLTLTNNRLSNYSGSGTITGIRTADGDVVSITNDSVRTITQNGNGAVYGIYHTGSGSGSVQRTISNNVIESVTGIGNGALYGIYHTGSGSGGYTVTKSANQVFSMSNAGGDCYGIYHIGTGSGSTNLTRSSNSVHHLTAGGSGACYGIYHTGSGSGGVVESQQGNTIDHLTAGGTGACYGIYHTGSGSSNGFNITRTNNNINNLSSIGGGACYGIYHTGSGSGGIVELQQGNTVDHLTAGSGGACYGIYHTGSGSSNGINITRTNNNINTLSSIGGGACYGIYHTGSGSGGIYEIQQGNIINQLTAGSGGPCYGIYHTGSGSSNGIISNYRTSNTITNLTASGSGACYGIYHTGSGSGGFVEVQHGNSIDHLTAAGSGACYGIYHTGSGSSNGVFNLTRTNNAINNLTASGNGACYGIYHTGSGSGGIVEIQQGNTIDHLMAAGSGACYGIYHTGSGSGGINMSRTSNNINTLTAAGSGACYGIYHTGSGSGGLNVGTARSNSIHHLGNTGGGPCYGIYHTGSGSGGINKTRAYQNQLNNLSTTNGSLYGVYLDGLDSADVQSNIVGKLQTTDATVTGIDLGGSVLKGKMVNNVIGDFITASSASLNALTGAKVRGGSASVVKVHYNSIYLGSSSSAPGFGTNAIDLDPAGSVEMRNNLIINKSTTGTGKVKVIKRLGAITPTLLSSTDNNCYFVQDSTQASNYTFYTGGTNFQGFYAYRNAVGFETNSFAEDVNFQSLAGDNPNFLKPNLTVATKLESGGSVSNLGALTDAAGNPRFGAPGYSGTGTATDVGAYENNYLPSDRTWLGTISDAWTLPGNWSANSVPGFGAKVIIPSSAAIKPRISSGTVCVGGISFSSISGGTSGLTVSPGASLIVNSDISGKGNITGGGNVVLSGSIGINLAGNLQFENLKIQTTGPSVTISPAATTLVSINRSLLLQTGNLITNGNLRLAAGSTRTAFISGAGTGTISGNVIVEKRNTNGYGYHYFGVPVTGATFSQLSDDITLQGTDGLQYVPNFATPLFATCWRYDETNTTPDVSYGWVGTVAGSNPIETGRGYASMIQQGVVLDVTGPVNHGAFTSGYSVSRTPSGNSSADGYNLISNPYPSPISWNALRGLPGQVDFAASYFAWRTSSNSYSGNYGYFNGTVGTLGVTDTISSFQGFKVIKLTPGSQPFIANNGIRINSPTPAFLRKQTPPSLRLRLEMGSDEDEAVAYIPAEGATDEAAEKVRYPFGNLLSMSIVNGAQKALAIYPESGLGSTQRCLPLILDVPQAGAAHLMVQTENWAPGESIWLEDRERNVFERLEPGQPHYLNLPKGEVAGRLFLHLAPSEPGIDNALSNTSGSLYYRDGMVYVQPGIQNAAVQLDVLNLLGQKVFETTVSGQSGIVRIPLPALHGTFLVQAVVGNQREVIKVVMP